MAAVSSRPIGKCDDPADPLDAPTLVQVSFYHLPLGQVIQPIIAFDAGAPLQGFAASTILGSPDGKQLLVALTDNDGAAQVLRYGCQ